MSQLRKGSLWRDGLGGFKDYRNFFLHAFRLQGNGSCLDDLELLAIWNLKPQTWNLKQETRDQKGFWVTKFD